MNYTIKWGVMLLLSQASTDIDLDTLKGIIAGIAFIGIILSGRKKKNEE